MHPVILFMFNNGYTGLCIDGTNGTVRKVNDTVRNMHLAILSVFNSGYIGLCIDGLQRDIRLLDLLHLSRPP